MTKGKDNNEAITITFGDVCENHVGMQKIGSLSNTGFSYQDLKRAHLYFKNLNIKTRLINLKATLLEEGYGEDAEDAYLLIIKGGNESADSLYSEQKKLEPDTKCLMYGRLVNKHARYNLCFSEESQEPDYEAGKGRIYGYDTVPFLKELKEKLKEILGDVGANLNAEGNYYYDVTKCGIGYHGDSERRKVIAIRMGPGYLPLNFVWYKDGIPVSKEIEINDLKHGDMYIMSNKATGFDWKKKKIYTLRHAAGCSKYTSIKEEKKK